MRRTAFLLFALSCLGISPAAPAFSKEGNARKVLLRARVWSIDAKQGYMVLTDEMDQQYVVSCEKVRLRSRSAKSRSGQRIQVGDAVVACCHALQ